MRKKIFFLSVSTLTCGTMVYLLFRVSTLKVFSWLKFLGIDILNSDLRKNARYFASKMPEFLIYSLPDGLWIFSYIVMMFSIWNFEISNKNLFWLLIIPLIAITSELLQISNTVLGTFDMIDLIFYLLGSITPFIMFRKQLYYNHLKL